MAQRTMSPAGGDKYTPHWRTLQLMPGAPACVIKAAHRYFIEIHHPDRGGSVADAQRVNVAFDELKERGTKANEHVASFFTGEPWHVLGVSASADKSLAERAGKALASELQSFDKLSERVRWAVHHFGAPGSASAQPRPKMAPPPPPSRAPRPQSAPRKPVTPGKPAGLAPSLDFGSVAWHATATRELRLTWEQYAPYAITVDAEEPLAATVVASKAKPGRFVVTFAIDWESKVFRGGPTMRGYTLDAIITIRWGSEEAKVHARGMLHYPAEVAVSPLELDLGTVAMSEPLRTQVVLIATGATSAEVSASAWLARVDAAGKRIEGPLRLAPNTPVRVAFAVQWLPIVERASAVTKGKPVRPTGKITVRWGDGRKIDVPVSLVVQRR